MNANNKAIQYGVIISLLCIIYNILLLFINPEYAFRYPAYLGLVIMSIGMFICLRSIKQENDNYISFKDAFRTIFIIAIIVAIGNIIYSNVIMPLILPNYQDVVRKVTLESMQSWFDTFKVPQEARDKAMDDVLKKLADGQQVKVKDQVIAFIVSLIFNTFFGTVISLFMRSKGEKPNNDASSEAASSLNNIIN